jgi:hypothetical protein
MPARTRPANENFINLIKTSHPQCGCSKREGPIGYLDCISAGLMALAAFFGKPTSSFRVRTRRRVAQIDRKNCNVARYFPETVGQLPAELREPYRVVCNATIEAFFEGKTDRNQVRTFHELLGRYRRTYQRWFGTLCMECGACFGRSSPEEKPLAFWGGIMRTCGGLAAATGKLAGQLRITLFGRYRCHQRRIFRA